MDPVRHPMTEPFDVERTRNLAAIDLTEPLDDHPAEHFLYTCIQFILFDWDCVVNLGEFLRTRQVPGAAENVER